MRRWVLVLVLAGLPWASGVAADEPALEGRWVGEIEAADAVLHVELEITPDAEGSLEGEIVILEHGAVAKRLTDVRQDGLRVRFRILNMAGFPIFQGWIEAGGEVVSGTLTQAGVAMPFRLERAEPPGERARTLLVGVEAMIEQSLLDFRVPGLVLGVVLDGQVVLEQAFGVADLDTGKPMTTETRIALGTATETFTVAMLAAGVDDGLLTWDDRVAVFLPELLIDAPLFWANVSVRDVMAHRTGVPSHVAAWYGEEAPRADLAARLAHLPTSGPVRSAFNHQVLGSLVVARIVEGVYSGTWESVIAGELIEPLGMLDTGLEGVDESCAQGYREHEGELAPVTGPPVTSLAPAIGAVTSVGDLLIWVRAHLERIGADGLVISKEATLHELMAPQIPLAGFPGDPDLLLESYGLGWFVESYRGRLHVHRSGDADGFTSQLSILPMDDVAVVVAANVEGTRLPELLARQLVDRLLELEYRDWLGQGLSRSEVVREAVAEARRRQTEERGDGGPPLRDTGSYVGTYEHPGYGSFSLVERGDGLLMTRGSWQVRLVHWRDDVFQIVDDPADLLPDGTPISFRVSSHGEVEAMVVPFEPATAPLVLGRRPASELTDPDFLDRLVGSYRAVGRRIQVDRRGDGLVMTIGGGRVRRLIPGLGGAFTLEGRPATRVEFVVAGDGPAAELRFDQPGGEFVASRVAGTAVGP
jgi:CubicO group peptidase (beta-lactamase class C family)